MAVLRAIDKLDRLGEKGVIELLGEGRTDESGDFTPGARLSNPQIDVVLAYLRSGSNDRAEVCDTLERLVSRSSRGYQAVGDLRQIDEFLRLLEYADDRVVFDPAHAARTTRDRVRTSADAEPTTDLYLRPDRYRLTARSTDNRVFRRRTIDVSAATATQGH